jgi:hypothetical protein
MVPKREHRHRRQRPGVFRKEPHLGGGRCLSLVLGTLLRHRATRHISHYSLFTNIVAGRRWSSSSSSAEFPFLIFSLFSFQVSSLVCFLDFQCKEKQTSKCSHTKSLLEPSTFGSLVEPPATGLKVSSALAGIDAAIAGAASSRREQQPQIALRLTVDQLRMSQTTFIVAVIVVIAGHRGGYCEPAIPMAIPRGPQFPIPIPRSCPKS